jgi:hypothetical protein
MWFQNFGIFISYCTQLLLSEASIFKSRPLPVAGFCVDVECCHLHHSPQLSTQLPPVDAISDFLPEWLLFVNAELFVYGCPYN